MSNDKCRHCNGTGVDKFFANRQHRCSFCTGSGLRIEPKFRAECECGARQPRATTAWTAGKWMHKHLESHQPTGGDA